MNTNNAGLLPPPPQPTKKELEDMRAALEAHLLAPETQEVARRTLRRAAVIIRENGWRQGCPPEGDPQSVETVLPVRVDRAIMMADAQLGEQGNAWAAARMFADAVNIKLTEMGTELADWNDEELRTEQEVLTFLDMIVGDLQLS